MYHHYFRTVVEHTTMKYGRLFPNSKIILWHGITFEKYAIFRTKMKISIQDEEFENRSGR